jgi:catechol 2,3-dioxygenase-like lactoylglutathione lyase family enzyme
VTTTSFGPAALDAAVPPPPRPGPPLPPAAGAAAVLPSERARRSPITHVRYVALATEDFAASVAFYEGIWGLYRVGGEKDLIYLGAVGSPEPFVVRLRAAAERRTDLIAFGARDRAAVDGLAARLGSGGIRLATEPGVMAAPGGGYGFRFFDPDGRLVEVSADVAAKPYREIEPGESVPRKLSHIVVNSPDVPALMSFYERYFGLSDWLEDRMCFLRCSDDHHSLAVAQGPSAGLNHVSFEMPTLTSTCAARGGWCGTGMTRSGGTGGPGEDLFALWHRTPAESGLWVPPPV